MKPLRMFLLALCFVATGRLVATSETLNHGSLVGAWRIAGSVERVMIVTSAYWTQAVYDREGKQFVSTFGGTYTPHPALIEGRIEFDSEKPERVGDRFQVKFRLVDDRLTVVHGEDAEETWTRIDAAESPLAGTWRITGRQVDGTWREMPLRARRTLKILSGTRFQWVAINVEDGEFSGTGGGTYRFEEGKYTERIEFFSRDNSRVGAQLVFDGEVSGDSWRHRGRSSKGDPIDETWTRFTPAELRAD